MVNYFIYAKDFSGSTNGVSYYHSNGLETLEKFKCDVEKIKQEQLVAKEPPTESKIVYLHWGSRCWEVDEDETRRAYANLACERIGTEPKTIIQFLKEKFNLDKNGKIKLLYIITDGLIDSEDANECFIHNENMHYETVVFHAFNEHVNHIDLSVAASFFKGRCMVYRNNKLYDSTDISKSFDYDNINIQNYTVEKDNLKSYIKYKFINKYKQDAVALQEIEKLKKLRYRLFNELASKAGSNEKCKINLETKDRNVFLREFVETDWYKSLGGPVHTDKVEIEKSITTMINYIISDAKSYSFDALKFDTKFDKAVEEEEIVDMNFTSEQEIEFPDVILDDDKGIPVIILSKLNLMDKIIFHGQQLSSQVSPASFSKFKSTMECPLFLVNDQDVSESICYFYTLNVYKQLLANNTKNDPRTRKPFHGGLVLVDTNLFDKYNDFILSATYFHSKKLDYNVGLFYYALWKNCENKKWMDSNVVEQFEKYVMRRISETVCHIGLSSFPLDPQDKTSLPTALWYCVELSSCIFKNDPKYFKQERLRGYYDVTHYMIEILKYFNYNLDINSIEKRRELISYVMTLKKIQKPKEKVYYLLKRIFKSIDSFLVSEIEKPFNLYKINYLKLNHMEILRDDVVEDIVHLNNYTHLMHFVGDFDASIAGEGAFEICEKTFRPFFTIDHNKSFYTELIKNTRKVVINNAEHNDEVAISYEAVDSLEFDKILSLYKLFIDCVKVSMKYPTFDEYVEYVSKKKMFKNNLVTIFPSNVHFGVKNVYKHYQKIVAKVEVKEFIRVSEAHVGRIKRIKAEEKMKFNSDNEISEFISNQELKVNLKKNIVK